MSRIPHTLMSSMAIVLFTAVTAAGIPSYNSLIGETQRVAEADDRVGFVWWIPLAFWEMSMEAEPASPAEEIDAFVSVLDDYTLVAAADGVIGPIGGITWLSQEELRATIRLQDSFGHEYEPLHESEVNADARNLALMMKPLLVNFAGSMGENLVFFFFPSETSSGQPIADAKKTGTFSITLADETYRWRLPLGSLLPMKTCPVDAEELNGAWEYCPWHGKKLELGD